MTAVPDLDKAAAIRATGQTRTAAGVFPGGRASTEGRCPPLQVKRPPQGFSIDLPDPELGEQLMADALRVADRDAVHGILRQLVKASVNGQMPDAVNHAFMTSMAKSIRPGDSVVAMPVSVDVMAMRCAHRLANAEDAVQQESAGRAWETAIATMASLPSPCSMCRSGIAATSSSATSRSMRARWSGTTIPEMSGGNR